MEKQIKLLLIKASPSNYGCGSRILEDLTKFIKKDIECELMIFDQEKEHLEFGKSHIHQFVEAGKNDETEFERLLMKSDGIILFSPVFLRQMPGEFKITLDRFSYRMHEFPLIGKKLITFSYCTANGADDLAKYFHNIFISAGAEIVCTEEYYQALDDYNQKILCLQHAIKEMYTRIEKNLFNVTQTQEDLFKYYKAIVKNEKEKGIKTNRQKRWLELFKHNSICEYLEAAYIQK